MPASDVRQNQRPDCSEAEVMSLNSVSRTDSQRTGGRRFVWRCLRGLGDHTADNVGLSRWDTFRSEECPVLVVELYRRPHNSHRRVPLDR